MDGVTFAFEIGQTLQHKSAVGDGQPVLVVVQRMAVECHGGVQREYSYRSLLSSDPLAFGGNKSRAEVISGIFNESELVAYPAAPGPDSAVGLLEAAIDKLVTVQEFDKAAAVRTVLEKWKKAG